MNISRKYFTLHPKTYLKETANRKHCSSGSHYENIYGELEAGIQLWGMRSNSTEENTFYAGTTIDIIRKAAESGGRKQSKQLGRFLASFHGHQDNPNYPAIFKHRL